MELSDRSNSCENNKNDHPRVFGSRIDYRLKKSVTSQISIFMGRWTVFFNL
jgi:hypothetical protein